MSGSNSYLGLLRWTLALVLVSAVSCTTDYVTGKRTFSLVSESQEIQMGKESDGSIVAEYGAYDDPELSQYVSNIGQKIARTSQRSSLIYTFRVLDSPVVNAFALPGGYVYITRGILAHFNSEDELAGVVGHEVGHVVARHSAEQISRAQMASLGLNLGVMLSEDFARFADAAGFGVQLLFLKFSRDQESESDMLGVEYSTKLGYDAHRMAGFFKTLKSMSAESGQGLPTFLSTHPDPGNREVRVNALAGEWQGKVAYQPLNTDPKDYLDRIDGIVYGDDPRQGFVENNTFFHPTLGFQFPVPSGWQLQNTASSVTAVSEDQSGAIQLTLGEGTGAAAAADAFVSGSGAVVSQRKTKSVHGYPCVTVASSVKSDAEELRVLSYFIEKDSKVFVMHGFASAAKYDGHAGDFSRVMEGFNKVTDQSVLNRQPRHLRIKKAPAAGTMRSVLQALGTESGALQEMAVLNGKTLDDRVTAGTLVKVVGK